MRFIHQPQNTLGDFAFITKKLHYEKGFRAAMLIVKVKVAISMTSGGGSSG